MAKPTGFIEYRRENPSRRPVRERVRDYGEIERPMTVLQAHRQSARCMDCGTPFCQAGCPLGNVIPDFNDLVYLGRWEQAMDRLHATNNFPEFTGRVCPAPCEQACVLGIIDQPVAIERIEYEIVERAFADGRVEARPPLYRTGRRVAVIGSGPAGLACAQQLNRAGHLVTVFERADRIGGLLRYGIPDFKLEKRVVDRRLDQMRAEGVEFVTNAEVGVNHSVANLGACDAVVVCGGATRARDLPVDGRGLPGIHFAMEYLTQSNRRVAGDTAETRARIDARGKDVVVIGGGDTGSDCVGTANRQGARSVTQFEILPTPPVDRTIDQPWPFYPMILRASTSHEEGCDRAWNILTKSFSGNGRVERLHTAEVRPRRIDGRTDFVEVEGTEREWPADLVLLAMGFVGPEKEGLVARLGLKLDARGNVSTDARYRTSVEGVFSAGDMRRGQSLVVWAISEGREAAHHVDAHLMGSSSLPLKGKGDLPRA
jgi:glutamate synthase (NADPH) small chain